ncbi:MAG: hypothetical protein M1814_005209 [Vezdaea aestivalis]|nr:MAG: hypothetical protein M1814_005209 [Vezdaea aestivalis]
MDMPVNVPVDDPNADTEWNDILRKHGVIPEKPPSPTPLIEEALNEARRLAHENRLEGRDLDELDELEDEEDEVFLEQYRKRRLAELSTIQKTSLFNQVFPLQKPDYANDVTEASKKAFVLVHLTSAIGSNIESRLLSELWRSAAQKFGDVKFCEIRADLCIEGYPERNCPTILVYRDTEIRKQVVTLKELGGEGTTMRELEKLLVSVGAVSETDARVLLRNGSGSRSSSPHMPYRSIRNSSNQQKKGKSDDDDDWD